MSANYSVSRRTFVQCGCAATALALSRPLAAQDTRRVQFAEWQPCMDVGSGQLPDDAPERPMPAAPVRSRDDDLLTPVDLALIEQNEALANALSDDANNARASAAQGLASAAVVDDLGLPASAPAQLAAKNRWPASQLRIYFYNGSPALKRRVREVADKWCQFANMNFREVTQRSAAEIRIAFQGTGHWSYIGIDSKTVSGQTMNLQMTEPPRDSDYNHGVILHEFGHALGCIHEHQSPTANALFNEAAVLQHFRRYGWNDAKIRLNVLNRYNSSQLMRGVISAFDIKSVMLYSYPAELTRDRRGTPVNVSLSPTDIEFIKRLYPDRTVRDPNRETTVTEEPAVAATRTLSIGGDPLAGYVGPAAEVNVYQFEVSSAGTYTIRTGGYTQVDFKLFKGEAAVELSNTPLAPDDLVNRVVSPQLTTGKYRLEVRHRAPGGAGEYAVKLLQGVQ